MEIYFLNEAHFDPAHPDGWIAVTRRVVGPPEERLRQVLQALIDGPTPDEQDAGAVRMYPDEMRDLFTVTFDRGHVVVDFDEELTSLVEAGSTDQDVTIIISLDGAIFALPEVSSREYQLGGSCEAFHDGFLHGGMCEIRDRERWRAPPDVHRDVERGPPS